MPSTESFQEQKKKKGKWKEKIVLLKSRFISKKDNKEVTAGERIIEKLREVQA